MFGCFGSNSKSGLYMENGGIIVFLLNWSLFHDGARLSTDCRHWIRERWRVKVYQSSETGINFLGLNKLFSLNPLFSRNIYTSGLVSMDMFFPGPTANPTLSTFLEGPTELLHQMYSQPLIPSMNLPFNLLFTMNALRLNLEYHKSQRGINRGYLQVSSLSIWGLISRVYWV